MRVVFMGTPAFAVPSLEALNDAHDVVLVVTRSDSPAGRGGARRSSEVKDAALRLGLDLLQPQSLQGDAVERIREAHPDVVCVAAFGMLLPVAVLRIPRLGCINVHASLLPRHRGAAPVQRAILEGETETGVSIMLMEEGLDTGPFACQARVMIGDKSAGELEAELAEIGAGMLLRVLQDLEGSLAAWTAQDDSIATYAAKITKDDVALLPELTVAEAHARVRASTRRAPARACIGDRELTVVRAHPVASPVRDGAFRVEGVAPILGFSDGALELDTVRPAGRGDMAAADWARGARLGEGVSWRCTR